MKIQKYQTQCMILHSCVHTWRGKKSSSFSSSAIHIQVQMTTVHISISTSWMLWMAQFNPLRIIFWAWEYENVLHDKTYTYLQACKKSSIVSWLFCYQKVITLSVSVLISVRDKQQSIAKSFNQRPLKVNKNNYRWVQYTIQLKKQKKSINCHYLHPSGNNMIINIFIN